MLVELFLRSQMYKIHPADYLSFTSIKNNNCHFYDYLSIQKYITKIRQDLSKIFFTRLIKHKKYQELRLYDNENGILFCIIKIESNKNLTLSIGPQFHPNIKYLRYDVNEEGNKISGIIEDFIAESKIAIILDEIDVIYFNDSKFLKLNIEIRKNLHYNDYFYLFEEKTVRSLSDIN